MKITKYKSFLEKAIREDEFSYLNDDLDRVDEWDEWDDEDPDDGFGSWGDKEADFLNKKIYAKSDKPKSSFRDEDYDDYVEEDEEDDFDLEDEEDENGSITSDDMKHLMYLLRTMFKNSGIDVQIENKGLDIMIYCVMNRKERLKDIVSIFSVANKLKKDILPQYVSEFEMWETKERKPMMVFYFYYSEGLEDDDDSISDRNSSTYGKNKNLTPPKYFKSDFAVSSGEDDGMGIEFRDRHDTKGTREDNFSAGAPF